MRPLAAFVAFYRDGVKVFETEPEGIDGWNATSRAMPVRLQVPLTRLSPGRYDCQVTVLDPSLAVAQFYLADALAHTGALREALAAVRRGLLFDPANAQALSAEARLVQALAR